MEIPLLSSSINLKKHPARYLLVGILVVAILLRFVGLGSVPAGLDWDEAAIGYNAYSLLHTGRDEYGVLLPAVFRSFDDFKPPLYEYLDIIPVAMFGLEPWVIRLPSAVFGALAVLGVYFLVCQLLQLASVGVRQRWRWLPAAASFCLAISPWHVHFSRVAFEANLGGTLNIWFAVCFFKGLKTWLWFIPSAFFAGLALYAYHSERLFLPLLALFLVVYFRKAIFVQRWRLLAPILVGLVVILPLALLLANPLNWSRVLSTSSVSNSSLLMARTVVKLNQDLAIGNTVGRYLFDTSYVVYAQKIADGYLSHFSLLWLFVTGDNERHHAPGMGLLYLADLPFLFLGMYALVRRGKTMAIVLFFWFLSAPLAASVTNDLPHAVRTLVFLPTFQIFIAIGWIEAIVWLAARRLQVFQVSLLVIVGLYSVNFGYYLDRYYNHMDQEYASSWQYGYRQVFDYLNVHGSEYQQVIISPSLGQPYIFTLFYTGYSPSRYLKEGGSISGRNHFGMYAFQPIEWTSVAPDPRVLYIGVPSEIPGPALETIRLPDGSGAIKIAVKQP